MSDFEERLNRYLAETPPLADDDYPPGSTPARDLTTGQSLDNWNAGFEGDQRDDDTVLIHCVHGPAVLISGSWPVQPLTRDDIEIREELLRGEIERHRLW